MRNQPVLQNLQKRFGTLDRSRWQVLRQQFYSAVAYPAAGQSEILFFGNTLATSGYNRELTNIPKANSFGTNHFLLKAIHLDVRMQDLKLESYASTDVTTFAADMLYGFVSSGLLELKIGARSILEIPRPFLQCPPGNGVSEMATSGLDGVGAGTGVAVAPHVDLCRKKNGRFLVNPELLIEAEQQFELKLSYPSGLLPVLSTTLHNASTNPIYVYAYFDGLLYRPVQ